MKRIIDIMMMILLLLVMAFPFTGENIHIFLGIMMMVCFVMHHYLNRQWYHRLLKGKNTKIKTLFMLVNGLLLVGVVCVGLSGMTLAGYLSFMPYFIARKIHLVGSYWSYLLMGLHVGLHLQLTRYLKNKIVVYMMVIIGVIFLIKNQFIIYLFNMTDFLYVGDQMNLILYIIQYLFIFIVFMYLMNEIVEEVKK